MPPEFFYSMNNDVDVERPTVPRKTNCVAASYIGWIHFGKASLKSLPATDENIPVHFTLHNLHSKWLSLSCWATSLFSCFCSAGWGCFYGQYGRCILEMKNKIYYIHHITGGKWIYEWVELKIRPDIPAYSEQSDEILWTIYRHGHTLHDTSLQLTDRWPDWPGSQSWYLLRHPRSHVLVGVLKWVTSGWFVPVCQLSELTAKKIAFEARSTKKKKSRDKHNTFKNSSCQTHSGQLKLCLTAALSLSFIACVLVPRSCYRQKNNT